MKDTEKSGIAAVAVGAAAIGTVALLGYEAITYFFNPAASATKQCSSQQTTCFNNWLSAMNSYQATDSANGTGITEEQQSVLNSYMTCVNNAQANCLSAYQSLDISPTAIIGNFAGLIGMGIAAAIAAYGLGKALSQLKSKPPKTGSGKTWAEAMAYLLPLMVQTNLNDGKISRTFAESFRTYAPGVLSPILTQSATTQIAYFQDQAIITAELASAMALLATESIAFDIELAASIVVLA